MLKKMKFIHIGHHKTGSTFFQNKVMPKIEIFKLPSAKKANGETNQEFKQAWIDLVTQSDLNFDFNRIKKEFNKLDYNCLSNEAFLGYGSLESGACNLIKHSAKRLFKLFGETKILLVIRNQETWVKSLYFDDIEYGYTCNFKKWIEIKKQRNQLDWCKYSKIIKVYSEIFGSKNIHVLLFENLFNKKKNIKTLFSFFKQFGVDENTLKKIDFTTKINYGMGDLTYKVALFLNRVIGTRANFANGLIQKKWYHNGIPFFDNLSNKINKSKPKIEFEGYKEIIHQLYAKDNSLTSKLINVNLKNYGYCIEK